MFDWLRKSLGSNATKLNTTIKQAVSAANKYGNNNSRRAALVKARQSDDAAKSAKEALDLAQGQLKVEQNACKRAVSIAEVAVAKAQAAYGAVKDGVLRRALRFTRTGHWGSKENVTRQVQANMKAKANSRTRELKALAAKQVAEMKAREEEQRKRKTTLDRILGVSADAEKAVNSISAGTAAGSSSSSSSSSNSSAGSSSSSNSSAGSSTPTPPSPTPAAAAANNRKINTSLYANFGGGRKRGRTGRR
jgi:membrane protein involved in colicin uptake